ncbi:hypothetical protein TNCV_2342911 [Trichonephila clavipes]|nr:hypothetical protein TNCV_2342911 [Trichonephila clavipes]
MAVIDSPKKLRIYLDPRPLNEAIQRPHYPNPYCRCTHYKAATTSVNYLCHVLSIEGIKRDPKKIRAIEEFATPNFKDFSAVTVSVDASKNGFGAVLLQEGQPVWICIINADLTTLD